MANVDRDPHTEAALEDQRVELRFPGSPAFLRLARLATADAGSRAGLDVDEIEDLRIAVSEMCAMVGTDGTQVELVFRQSDGAVHIDGVGAASELDGENAEMARALVAAVVDEQDLAVDGDRTRFRIVKRHRG
jgi:serine/threonine-protein kinase RsbW